MSAARRSSAGGFVAALFALLLWWAPVSAGARAGDWIPLDAFPTQDLVIERGDGTSAAFSVYVATSPRQKRQGLMNVRSLPADHGMLFLFYPAQPVSMWMKNTLIGLDMLFIREDGTIANIITAEPLTLTSRSSEGRVTAVLELNEGTAARLGIGPGDRVRHPHFSP